MSNRILGESRKIALERIKKLSQRGNDTQTWMCLVVKVKSNAGKKKKQIAIGT